MKRITVFLLLAALLCTAIAPAMAAVMLPTTQMLSSNAHLRAEPSADSASKMILMKGYQVTVLEVANGWLRVKYGNYYGYIRGDLVYPAADNYFFTLSKGMQGAEVRQLQETLYVMGFFTGTPDGYFGDSTVRAVAALQSACGMVPSGIVDSDTYALIDMLVNDTGAVDPYASVGSAPSGSVPSGSSTGGSGTSTPSQDPRNYPGG